MANRDHESKRLFGELWLAMNAITRGIDAELKPLGLTHAQFQVLLHVIAAPDISQRELSERLNVTTGNVSMLVSKLQSAGYVDRLPDGAAVRLRVTDEGRRMFDSLGETRQRFIRDLFGRLSVDDIARTADVLHNVRPS